MLGSTDVEVTTNIATMIRFLTLLGEGKDVTPEDVFG